MSDDRPPTSPEDKSIDKVVPAVPLPDVIEQKLNEALKDLPQPKQELFRESVHELFMGIVQRGSIPTIDAETAKILADSADKEHEYRFKFRTQVQKDSAEESLREHEFERIKYESRVKLFVPILATVLITVVGCLVVGIYLASNGRELLGTGLITGTAFAVAGYLAGVGTSGFFKNE